MPQPSTTNRPIIIVAVAAAAVVVAWRVFGARSASVTPVTPPPAPRPTSVASIVATPGRALPREPHPAVRGDGNDAAAPAPVLPPARDGLSPKDTRRLVERVLQRKLGRDLPPGDYDRVTDAVMRLRAAASARDREAMLDALADIQAITGLAPSELGEPFTAGDSAGSP